jgi:hypothetical protein
LAARKQAAEKQVRQAFLPVSCSGKRHRVTGKIGILACLLLW